MNFVDFPIDYKIEVTQMEDELKEEVESRLLDLAGDHNDMTGAAVALTKPAQSETAFLFQARIVVYTRPENLAAVKKSDTAQGAVKGALDAIERQVREKRKKLGEPWKRSDIPGTPGSA